MAKRLFFLEDSQAHAINDVNDGNISPVIVADRVDAVIEGSLESMGGSESCDTVLSFLQILGTTNTQSKCFICESPTGRNALPWPAIQQVWFQKKIYIPKSNRTCKAHLNGSKKFNEESLQKIEATKKGISVKRSDFELWLDKVSNLPNLSPYNFDEGGIDAGLYRTFCGISKSDFDDLVTYLHGKNNISRHCNIFKLICRFSLTDEIISSKHLASQ